MKKKNAAPDQNAKSQGSVDPRVALIAPGMRRLNAGLRAGHVSESTKAKMRAAAAKHPELLGAWANV
jgi:hypothetical protein